MRTGFGRTARTLALALLLTSLAAGCTATTGGSATDAVCDVLKPISWSSRDTDETVAGVKQHNAVHKAICK